MTSENRRLTEADVLQLLAAHHALTVSPGAVTTVVPSQPGQLGQRHQVHAQWRGPELLNALLELLAEMEAAGQVRVNRGHGTNCVVLPA